MLRRAVRQVRSPRDGGGVTGELRQLAREIVLHVGGARAEALWEVEGLRLDLGRARARLALGQRREKLVELRRAVRRGEARCDAVGRGGARWGAARLGRGAAGARQWARQRARLGYGRVWHSESGAGRTSAEVGGCDN